MAGHDGRPFLFPAVRVRDVRQHDDRRGAELQRSRLDQVRRYHAVAPAREMLLFDRRRQGPELHRVQRPVESRVIVQVGPGVGIQVSCQRDDAPDARATGHASRTASVPPPLCPKSSTASAPAAARCCSMTIARLSTTRVAEPGQRPVERRAGRVLRQAEVARTTDVDGGRGIERHQAQHQWAARRGIRGDRPPIQVRGTVALDVHVQDRTRCRPAVRIDDVPETGPHDDAARIAERRGLDIDALGRARAARERQRREEHAAGCIPGHAPANPPHVRIVRASASAAADGLFSLLLDVQQRFTRRLDLERIAGERGRACSHRRFRARASPRPRRGERSRPRRPLPPHCSGRS